MISLGISTRMGIAMTAPLVPFGSVGIRPKIRRILCRLQIVSVLNGNLLRINWAAGIASLGICFFGTEVSHGFCTLHWRRAPYTFNADFFDLHIRHPFFYFMYQRG